jgi:SAM-dependent methyltransferase
MLVEPICHNDRVLDIGCGTGAVTLACARKGADSTGVDISESMLALARRRAERDNLPARFVSADAQQHAFAAGSFNRIVSRFGVMFFEDPVRAFANLHQAASPDAVLHCLAWRSPAENPFMTAAELAAKPLLPALPARKSDAPGQFAFADGARTTAIVQAGGWRQVKLAAVDVACAFPLAALETYFTRLGPLGLLLQEADEDLRAQILAAVWKAFEPYVSGDEVRFTAACWAISARGG